MSKTLKKVTGINALHDRFRDPGTSVQLIEPAGPVCIW